MAGPVDLEVLLFCGGNGSSLKAELKSDFNKERYPGFFSQIRDRPSPDRVAVERPMYMFFLAFYTPTLPEANPERGPILDP
jgi:hypothetical protein